MVRVIALLAALAAGCSSPTSPDAVLGKPFELKTGATSELPDGSRLTFARVVSDSRCPIDAICVSAGDAEISIQLSPPKGQTESRSLHTQPSGSQISYGSYTIALTELAPYPQASRPTPVTEHIATFLVTLR
jgi:hypothetical protein